MGSRSSSVTTAIDNRLGVADNAFGLSSSGSGNNVTANGNIFNLSAGGVSGGSPARGTGGSSSGQGGTLNFSMLDGGAVDRSFDFAETSLSKMLASVIEGQKAQQEAANYQADTVGAALQQSAQVQAAAQEKTLAWLSGNGKILAGGAVALLVGFWIWRNRGKK
jgi:hypothetical protein